jgi:hypothetical protein
LLLGPSKTSRSHHFHGSGYLLHIFSGFDLNTQITNICHQYTFSQKRFLKLFFDQLREWQSQNYFTGLKSGPS